MTRLCVLVPCYVRPLLSFDVSGVLAGGPGPSPPPPPSQPSNVPPTIESIALGAEVRKWAGYVSR